MTILLIWLTVVLIGVILILARNWIRDLLMEGFVEDAGIPSNLQGVAIAEKLWRELLNDGVTVDPNVARLMRTYDGIFAIIADMRTRRVDATNGIAEGIYDERHPLDLVRMTGWGYMSETQLTQQLRNWRVGISQQWDIIFRNREWNYDKQNLYKSLNEDLLNFAASEMRKYSRLRDSSI